VVLYKGPFSGTESAQIGEIISTYQKKFPQVTVREELFDWQQMDQQLPTKLLSSSPPDVFYAVLDQYGKWAPKGVLEDLTPYVKHPSWKSEYDAVRPDLWNEATLTKDNKIYGVPWGGLPTSLLFVNTDLLQRAGVTDFTSSYDAFRTACQRVSALQSGLYGMSIRQLIYNPAAFDWSAWMYDGGGSFFNQDQTKCALDTPGTEQTLQFLADLQNKDKVTPAPGAYDWNGLRGLWEAGKVAIQHDETTYVSILQKKSPGFKWDVSTLPIGPGGKPVAHWLYGLLCIPKASQNKVAAWEFIKHAASATEEARYFQEVGFFPCRTDILGSMYTDNPVMTKVGKTVMPAVRDWPVHPKLTQMLTLAQPFFDSAYHGQITGAAALKQVSDGINGLL
jgi:multiple sugar transport system substrate-binding protein